MKKMSMKAFEHSAKDKAADKKSGHKEGSKADMRQDHRDFAKINKGRKK